MCNLFLADEINRTSPKTQSALLVVMEEGRTTVDGIAYQLPQPFTVLATQNPYGSAGTQLLPDSQLDRFMVRLTMGYPSLEDEIEILKRKSQENEEDKKKYQLTDEDFKDPTIVDITQTLKVITILGQIVKNQHGTFEKEKLIQLIESAYLACFRLINFFSSMLLDAKDEFLATLNKKIGNSEKGKVIIKKEIYDILYFLGYKMCLSSFSNLMQAIGTSSLTSLYDISAERIGSPAARLITFSIKTYYDRMSIPELESLMEEYKNNPVATHIIKARVANNLYNNHVPYDKKQKISSICNIKLIN